MGLGLGLYQNSEGPIYNPEYVHTDLQVNSWWERHKPSSQSMDTKLSAEL